jgi:putative hydrolase of the HAD superfamily
VHRFVKAVAFDFGHTLIEEHIHRLRLQLMPGVQEVLPRIDLPMAVWANTRQAGEDAVREILRALRIERYFSTVVTSVDAGFRKPAPEFFQFALSKWGFTKDEILFVGNQLNTDILGGQSFGIRTAWLSSPEFRSSDETMTLDTVKPTFTLAGFPELPALLEQIAIRAQNRPSR